MRILFFLPALIFCLLPLLGKLVSPEDREEDCEKEPDEECADMYGEGSSRIVISSRVPSIRETLTGNSSTSGEKH